MSLIDEMMVPCVLLEKTRTSDGEGGFVTSYTEGAEFNAAIVQDTSMQARIAAKEGVTSTYTITTARSLKLDFHDVLRRKTDNKTFRVTSSNEDKHTPDSASFQIAQVTAEAWEVVT